jgi:hypothetical protein
MTPDELSCMLRDEEDLLEELPSVALFSFLKRFLEIFIPGDKSCYILTFVSTIS